MLTVLEQAEALPGAYPTVRPTVPDHVWQRLETYIAWRFTPRAVTWIVEGCGEFTAPLKPATVTKVEIWDDASQTWDDITATAPIAPRGYLLAGRGPYRFTATVGDGVSLPAAVEQAAQRLAAYMAAPAGTPGATRDRQDIPGVMLKDVERSQSWMARALHNSGAADLLRNFRRA